MTELKLKLVKKLIVNFAVILGFLFELSGFSLCGFFVQQSEISDD